jgi:hypothetical protein
MSATYASLSRKIPRNLTQTDRSGRQERKIPGNLTHNGYRWVDGQIDNWTVLDIARIQ